MSQNSISKKTTVFTKKVRPASNVNKTHWAGENLKTESEKLLSLTTSKDDFERNNMQGGISGM